MAKKAEKKEKAKEIKSKQAMSYLPWAFLVILIIIAAYYPVTECKILAKVNGDIICSEEIDALHSRLKPEEKAVFTKSFLLNTTINERLLLQAAEIEGISVSDEKVESSAEAYLDELGISKEKYAYLLEAQNLSYDQFLEDYRKQLIISTLVSKITLELEVSDEEAAEYYGQHKNEFVIPEQVKVAHILLGTEEEAEEVLGQLGDGADFSELAKEKSIDPSAQSNGGILEYASREIFVPEFSDYVFGLSIGDVGIVETQYGFHVVKLIDKKPSQAMKFEEAERDIKGRILADKQRAFLQTYISVLRSKARIEITP